METQVVRTSRSAILALFRDILRQQRLKYTGYERVLADKFVKQEWRLHKQAKPDEVQEFLAQWSEYRDTLLKAQSVNEVARNLRASEVESLSDEQIAELEKMRKSAFETAEKVRQAESEAEAAKGIRDAESSFVQASNGADVSNSSGTV